MLNLLFRYHRAIQSKNWKLTPTKTKRLKANSRLVMRKWVSPRKFEANLLMISQLHNVFMRVDDPVIQKATGKTDPVEVMGKLREMKNNFK